ncbi:MAG: GMP reductase [Candidatus Woesebacteria bacterium GW2011_GWA1_33_30]|uniref:GMP reductase n=1 Tax=Candidatus Woesebacteria bacterium GW2011_GWA2_33_28 TaxID=1618561 RepID=A0A0F9ZR64_9BACT|nr:MAG: GMP reductase [Candidatus Woesebacteria bacterium GW2011_GWA2_33_28]KKP47565.1 MAG: GMP reductase [Candidatus Woesebacteria bacterium GW2011_GWA1_33_30]KKP49186.1 MAG: Inosine-5'-monophosphate dehydrogenase [Microgenomates group bacterium GW2011_GWC1_33_32]KKP51678.1 MAG: GMP reductase [Candidatus Woesebacteria bacterium GW2011_GWB1_33_38]KKP55698.1 MAG: GMP reductase [Microgenomates group bacterium GW2011_GWD1_33_9]
MKKVKDIPLALSYDDVLLVPCYSDIKSRSDVDLSSQITPRVKLAIPLISINMSDVTGVEMAISLGKLGGLGFLPRFETAEKQAEMVFQVKKADSLVGAAVGCKDNFLERAEMLARAGVDIITLDVAHAGMQQALDATTELKQRFGRLADIISGVVGTYETAEALYKAGADSVRVGVGPGTICITRTQTGFGVPQITAVLDCARAARKYKKTVLCDGGTKNSGDIVKGLAAGASAVIIGSQFAGHDEAPGEVVIKDEIKYKMYNASTSLTEKKRHVENLKCLPGTYTNHIEGVESLVPYKGPLKNSMDRWLANIRSGYSYCGARDITELWEKAKFVRITPNGVRESESHDVILL